MRHFSRALVCLFFLVGSLRAAQLKNATFKGIKNHLLVFEVDKQEVLVSAGDLSFKSFDQDGKPLTGRLGENVRPLVAGNVVDIVTSATKRTFSTNSKVEELTQVRLVKGELAEPAKTPKWPNLGEPHSRRGRRGQDRDKDKEKDKDKATYKAATVKSVEKKNVVLEVDGKEITLVAGNRMKFVDADGKQLKGKGLSKRILKEGAQLDVTTAKSDDGTETIREVRQVHGDGDEK